MLKCREEILAASAELQALVAGPLGHITRILSPTVNVLIGLQAIYRYKIAHSIGFEEEVSFEEIAQRCSLEVSDVRRLLRVATANYVFKETRKGFIIHTAISQTLVKLPFAFQWMGYVCDELWPSGVRTVDAMMKWPGSQEPNETGFALSDPSGEAFFDLIKHDAPRAQRLADSMKFLQSSPALSLGHLVKDLAWDAEACPEAMVDIGGSDGSISIELLRKYPRLTATVQDLPETIKSASVPDELAGRLEFKVHNFFEEQPVKNADVYFLRSVLHDWSDKYAVQILKNLVPALKNGAKVILNEVCLPEPNLLPNYHEQLVRGYDLAMKAKFNSKERDADDWAALFEVADTRFKMGRVRCSPGSILSVIEAVWQADSGP